LEANDFALVFFPGICSNWSMKRWQKWVLGALAITASFSWYVVFMSRRDGLLHVAFLNVGQGDAILIETPLGNQILIDGGPGRRVLSELNAFLPFYDRTLDMVIATHTDYDHLAGLTEVLKSYSAGTVIDNGFSVDTEIYHTWVGLLEKKKPLHKIAHAGDQIELEPALTLEILGPAPDDLASASDKANEVMVVSRLVYGGTEFLFTGDLEKGDEVRLAQSGVDLKSDVLKVAHHGSKNASTQLFLERVSPEYAVISVGKENRYGHPTPDALARLAKLPLKLFRTDTDGRVEFTSNGYSIAKR
jgi:competence protein ComEC